MKADCPLKSSRAKSYPAEVRANLCKVCQDIEIAKGQNFFCAEGTKVIAELAKKQEQEQQLKAKLLKSILLAQQEIKAAPKRTERDNIMNDLEHLGYKLDNLQTEVQTLQQKIQIHDQIFQRRGKK